MSSENSFSVWYTLLNAVTIHNAFVYVWTVKKKHQPSPPSPKTKNPEILHSWRMPKSFGGGEWESEEELGITLLFKKGVIVA